MAKETRLNDSADIYVKREKQSEKQKLSEMNTVDRFQYFKDYYFKKILLIGTIAVLSIYLLYTIFLAPKTETVLYTAVVNDYLNTDKVDAMVKDLENFYQINPKKQNIIMDTSYYLNTENAGTESLASEQKLFTYIAASQIDVIIADEAFFKNYAYNGYFVDLADQLPTDVYSTLSDSLYMSSTEEDKEENAYGIYLTNCDKYKDLGSVIEKPVIGILANSKHVGNGAEYIRYLYELK